MSIVARFFPNGEFSQGVDTSKRRRDKQRRDESFKPPLNKERRDEYLQWKKDNADIQNQISIAKEYDIWVSPCGHKYSIGELHSDSCTLDWRDETGYPHCTYVSKSFSVVAYEWRLTPLVYQSVESSEKPQSRKKLLGMTGNMARNIRNGVYLLEQMPGGKDCLSFLTLTLPSLSAQGLAKCCQNWDYMVDRFLDWLRTRLKKCNIQFEYVYCTEIQSKRLQQRNEYAPHLHIVFRGRDGKKRAWAITPKQARKAWKACLVSVVDEHFKCDALENLQRIKHSAARYLSKYMSKGRTSLPAEEGDVLSGEPESHIKHLHTQWGGMARGISRRIRVCTTRLTGSGKLGHLAVAFINNLELLLEQGYFKYFRRGFIPLGVSSATGLEYGLHVSSGCLSVPSYTGGIGALFQRLSELAAGIE